MKLKSFGCSFIYGTDLSDAVSQGRNAHYSLSTWPALLAQHFNLGYKCYARPGAGNLQIAEAVLNQIEKPALYVINWTYIDRFDYNNTKGCTWETIRPTSTEPVAETYYRDLHSQYRDKLTSLMAIYSVVTELKSRGYPFIMTYMDELLWEKQWHSSPTIELLQNTVQPVMGSFEGQTFLDWSRRKGFEISPGSHPTDHAHRAAYELAISHGWVAPFLSRNSGFRSGKILLATQ